MMWKFKGLWSLCLFMAFLQSYSQQQNDWENLDMLSINTEAPRATFYVYNSEDEAKENDPESSKNIQNLNGTWKFHFSETPDARPKEFYKTDYGSEGWDDIEVPGDWQMQGYDFPLYVSAGFNFPINPPYVDNSYNPVGSYKRKFSISENWDKQRKGGGGIDPQHSRSCFRI